MKLIKNKLFTIAALFLVFGLITDSSAQVRRIYNALLRGTTTIGTGTGDGLTLNGTITSNQTYSTATTPFFFRTSLTATSGTHNNMRVRGQNQATGASTSDLRGLYAQATTSAGLFGGSSTAIYANAIAKGTSTTTNLRGILIDTESEGTPTAIGNMWGLYIRNKSTIAITTDNYSITIDNEKMGSGIVQDAAIQIKTTTWGSGVTAWTYGIDMSQTGAFGTADIRFQNGATMQNSSASLLTITEATVAITGALTVSGATTHTGGIINSVVVVTDAATYTVLAANTGKVHMIGDLSQNTDIDMPAEAAGLRYEFWYIGAAAEGHDHTFDTEADVNFYIGGVSFLDHDAGPGAAEVDAGVYSDGDSNSKLTVNNISAGTKIVFISDGTNWYLTGIIISDTVPTMADQ